MRGGPGAQTPGNGGKKKHTPVTVEPAESAAVRHPPAPRAAGGHENFRKFAGRQIKFEYGSQLKKFVHTRI